MISEKISRLLSEKGFEIIEKIGQGGYAQVFTVHWDKYPEKIYVAKVITLEGIFSQAAANSYLAEVKVLMELYHSNIIQIFQHFKTFHFMFIIMEYCPRGTLQDFVFKNGSVKDKLFKQLAKQCLEGLMACHTALIAHRDIKPTNILLDEHYRVKLCDFGIAQSAKNGLINRHDGSLPYLPPEYFQNRAYDPIKADIWSLGITFFFLATGFMPWDGNTKEEMVNQITNANPKYPENLPSEILRLIHVMIKKEPVQRPTCEKILNDFFPPEAQMIKSPREKPLRRLDHFRQSRLSFSAIRIAYTCKVAKSVEQFFSEEGSS